MSDSRSTRSDADDRYRRARNDFEDFDFEQKATFLVEAMTSTLARGLEEAGKALSDEFGELFRSGRRRTRRHASDRPGGTAHGPGPAEPETSQRQAPR